MDVREQVLLAEQRIRAHVRETPLEHSRQLSAMTGCNVFLKLENLQHTGSFKVRGAMNKLLSLTPGQRARGAVAASSGNHGAAVAFGLHALDMRGTVFVPEHASPTKLAAIRCYGAETRVHGSDMVVTEAYARAYAERHGMTYVSPYNDPQVIGGQGTIAVELARQLDRVDAVLASVGGGGMIAGIAGYLKPLSHVRVVGCWPENSPVMAASIEAGHIVEMPSLPTLSDGTAGGIEPGAITFDLCRALVDDRVLVSEDEIRAALLLFIETHHMLIEGAAGVAIASLLKTKKRFRGQNVVVIVCGANIGLESLFKLQTPNSKLQIPKPKVFRKDDGGMRNFEEEI